MPICQGSLIQNRIDFPGRNCQAARTAASTTSRAPIRPGAETKNLVPAMTVPGIRPTGSVVDWATAAIVSAPPNVASYVGPLGDFVLQLVPQLFVQAGKLRREADAEHVARALDRDIANGPNRSGPGAE